MNANELAEYVTNVIECTEDWESDYFKQVVTTLRKLHKYEQVLQSIANEHIELSHDKIKWQCEDHVRWAKEALK